jgi:outer membrane lipoprotein-sorting protein
MFSRKTAFLAGLVLCLFVAIGCGGGSKDKSSGGTKQTPASGVESTAQPAQTRPAGAAASDTELAAFISAFTKVKSFKATMTIEAGPGQPKQEGTMEVILPDKYYLKFTGAAASDSFEIISIGNDLYTKFGPSWTKQSGGGIGRIFDPKQISDLAAASKNYTKGGTDTVNGKKCQLYTQSEGGSTTELCIADNLPLRVVTSGSGGSGKTTLLFSDYDKVGDIKAPI